MEWVDNERLLLLEGPIDTGGLPLRPLRLVTLDGQSTLIATLSGDHPLYSYYFEE